MRVIKNTTIVNKQGKHDRIVSAEDIFMTAEVKCNKCAKIMWKAELSNHPPTPEYLTIVNQWGKNSKWPGEIHEIHFCQDCYAKLVHGLQIKEINYVDF